MAEEPQSFSTFGLRVGQVYQKPLDFELQVLTVSGTDDDRVVAFSTRFGRVYVERETYRIIGISTFSLYNQLGYLRYRSTGSDGVKRDSSLGQFNVISQEAATSKDIDWWVYPGQLLVGMRYRSPKLMRLLNREQLMVAIHIGDTRFGPPPEV